MEALIFFVSFTVLLFLMMRFGCGAHVTGHGHDRARGGAREQRLVWTPPERDRDPVCGKQVRTAGAKPSVREGRVYYFCSRDCREIFEAAPELYVGGEAGDQLGKEHAHA